MTHEPICYVPEHPGRTCAEFARWAQDRVWEMDTVAGRPDYTLEALANVVTADPDHPRVTLVQITDALRKLGAQLHGVKGYGNEAGMGPDGPFVDVTGERLYMMPDFPIFLARMLELHEKKNREYRGDDPDPLANYVNAGKAAGRPGWEYAFERMAEKMNRAGHVLPGASVPVVVDTLMDLAVISLLVLSLRLDNR